MILLNQFPLTLLIRRRLTCDDHVFTMLLGALVRARIMAFSLDAVRAHHLTASLAPAALRAVSLVGVFAIQRHAGGGAVVEAGRLIDGVVAEAHGDEVFPVGDADVEVVGDGVVAQRLLLQVDDRVGRVLQRVEHLGRRVLLLPGLLADAVPGARSQVGHVQRGEGLGVCAAADVGVGLCGHEAGHLARDGVVGGDVAVVHDGVAAEDEGVDVDLCEQAGGGGADVREHAGGGGVGADGLEVLVVEGGAGELEGGGVDDGALGRGGAGGLVRGAEEGTGGGVPGHAEAVDVEEGVAHGDFGWGCWAGVDLGIVGEEEREIVVFYLFGD